MQRTLTVFVIAVLLAGCDAAEDTVAPPLQPRFNVEIDCAMLQVDCAKLLDGINWLLERQSPTCKEIGTNAKNRYDAPSGMGQGFKYMDQVTGYDMGVIMHQGTGTVSGWVPSDGYIGVMPSFWSSGASENRQQAGGLTAHEEGGHQSGEDGRYHNTGMADWYQEICSSEYN